MMDVVRGEKRDREREKERRGRRAEERNGKPAGTYVYAREDARGIGVPRSCDKVVV